MIAFKQKVCSYYLQGIHEKIRMLQKILDDLKESGKNETKSTAGDKHETALAMLQIEQENTRGQLKAAQEQLAIFSRIDFSLQPAKVSNGSLIRTNRGYLFLSVAAGKAMVGDQAVTALSPQSPLGMKLMGACIGDSMVVNNVTYTIEEIC
ncbi:MAG: hypothetical protein KF746_19115 [Chitinophagaceae bacterium]|nr:hypothetical protein [Chitinophagaceae bacterium]